MKKSHMLLTTLTPIAIVVTACSGFASKEALLDAAANHVIDKFQNASCEEVAQMQPQSAQSSSADGESGKGIQEKAIALLKKDPQMREEFINRVAGPIANRMFECKLIP
ncbi:MAG: hypothetical protein F6J86_31830 [Symploca sp. SIO1B1]|nr:hypothetical protein [Symploca sp. SIO1B1]